MEDDSMKITQCITVHSNSNSINTLPALTTVKLKNSTISLLLVGTHKPRSNQVLGVHVKYCPLDVHLYQRKYLISKTMLNFASATKQLSEMPKLHCTAWRQSAEGRGQSAEGRQPCQSSERCAWFMNDKYYSIK